MSKTAYRGFNPSTVVGGLRDDFNQEWYPTRNMSSNRTSAAATLRNSAKLDGLLFIDWDVINPPPPPTLKKSRSSSSSSSSEDPLAKEKKAEQKRIAEEKKKEIDKKKAEFDTKFKTHSGGKATMDINNAAAFSRDVGYAVTAAEFLDMEKKVGSNITLEHLMKQFVESTAETEPHGDLANMFRIFDHTGSGLFSKKQLKNILMEYGEPLSSEEFDCLMEELGYAGVNEIDYRKFCEKLAE